MSDASEQVLDFWFQELTPEQWFRADSELDQRIRERFADLVERVWEGEHDGWAVSPRGRLALVLALDQFPRNIYRGTARSFAYDTKALALALEGIALGVDEQLKPVQRAFFYLPLEHSEEMAVQDRSLERYARLAMQAAPEVKAAFREYLDYAWRHYVIIRRFGRYPHRNEILGRESFPEEKAFLKEPGSRF